METPELLAPAGDMESPQPKTTDAAYSKTVHACQYAATLMKRTDQSIDMLIAVTKRMLP